MYSVVMAARSNCAAAPRLAVSFSAGHSTNHPCIRCGGGEGCIKHSPPPPPATRNAATLQRCTATPAATTTTPAHAMPPKVRVSKPLFLENQTDKRRDRAQELRSARRQGVLAKRRKFTSSTPTTAAAATPAVGGGGASSKQHQEPWSRETLSESIRGVKERPVSQVLPYLVELRKLLSLEDPPVEEVVEGGGLAPRLMELLSAPNDEIQTETTWSVLVVVLLL